MGDHQWIPSTLGHGETMCANCLITNLEVAALGEQECPRPPEPTTDPVRMALEALEPFAALACAFKPDDTRNGLAFTTPNLSPRHFHAAKAALAALRSLDGGKGFERPESPSGDAGPVARAAPEGSGQ